MDEVTNQAREYFEMLFGAEAGLAELLLRLLVSILLLVAGWLIAAMVKRLTIRLLASMRRIGGGEADEHPGYAQTVIHVVANLIFWAVMIFFVALAGRNLDLTVVERGMEALVAYLPSLGSGILIILAGIILGGLAYPVVAQSAQSRGLARGALIGRLAQIAIVAIGVVIGTTEFGIDVSFLTNVALVILSAVTGAFGLGLALGTPAHVSNIIGARNIRPLLHAGERIRIDDFEGTVAEITGTHVVLETDEGDIVVPARLFAEKACIRLAGDERGSG